MSAIRAAVFLSPSPHLESELDYLARRAGQEREQASRARSPQAAMAHRYLAAAYARRVAEAYATPPELQSLLSSLDAGGSAAPVLQPVREEREDDDEAHSERVAHTQR